MDGRCHAGDHLLFCTKRGVEMSGLQCDEANGVGHARDSDRFAVSRSGAAERRRASFRVAARAKANLSGRCKDYRLRRLLCPNKRHRGWLREG